MRQSDSIRIRLNSEMMEYITKKSIATRKSISEIIREYVRNDMKRSKDAVT